MSGGYGDPQNMVEALPSEPAWYVRAACRGEGIDPEMFWAADNSKLSPTHYSKIRSAKAVCEVCPVRSECLDRAIDNNEQFGIWGGLTPAERRTVRKKRRMQVARSSA